MPPKSKAARKAPASSAKATKAAVAAAARLARKAAEDSATAEWIDSHDTLLDKAPAGPIHVSELFSRVVTRKTFAAKSSGGSVQQQPYEWTEFQRALAARTASSPRWFVQLREEDLLAGDDGLEGVTVNCFVIAEASQPTLAPAEYVVKVHWPYSDAEDNAPERILPITGQGMCWRRVVKDDGSDINLYLLQKRNDSAAAAPSTAPAISFGFGASTSAAPASAPAPAPAGGFGFGFGTAAPAAAAAAAPASFGFGAAAPTTAAAAPIAFGFGSTAAAPAAPASFGFGAAAPTSAAAAPASFGFGAAAAAATAPAASPEDDSGAVTVQPLKSADVLFCLWSRRRLTGMAQEVRSGSRIVLDKFALDDSTSMKLVMENDRTDEVEGTAHKLILQRLFAKQDDGVKEVDQWISDCPVYDEQLTAALQDFREKFLTEAAEESEEFNDLYSRYHDRIEAELRRIVAIRRCAAQKELDAVDDILLRLKDGKLAEKATFRLLKYYPKNDVLKFRPFGKVSGISEMGESVDLCVPPAHVNINPFTGKPS